MKITRNDVSAEVEFVASLSDNSTIARQQILRIKDDSIILESGISLYKKVNKSQRKLKRSFNDQKRSDKLP
jgi:hypothetical protein